ncbi:MAG: AAA family ATPase [Ignavibacteriae bacterium]|nr:AAA family ATPase [Ignavibacteriota bacterium]
MLISNVHIENFKRFQNLPIDFQSLDCLVGGNNSGKSTLLQAMALYDFVVHNCLFKKDNNGNANGRYQIEVKNRSIAPEEFVVLPVARPIDFWTDRISQRQRNHIIISVKVTFENKEEVKANLDLNYNRFSISLETKNDQPWLQELMKFKISYLPVFSTFLTQEERRTPAVIEDALARGRVNSVIRNLLYNLNKEGKIHELESILKNAIPGFNNLSIRFDEITDRFIDVSYNEEGKKKEFDLFMAGSGFQQFVYLFGFILLRDPNVILLDEPDVHLHGTLQASLLEELKRLVTNGKQVIFATHSKDLITKIDADNIIFLNDGKATRLKVNFDKYETLESLGSIDNIQIAQMQAFKRLLVVEDYDDWKYLQVFGRKILGESNWQKVERRLAVCPAKGNPYTQDMPRLKKQLTSMFSLGSSGTPLKLFVICDLDYYPDREELLRERNKQDSDIEFYIWQRSEIENYLLNTKIIWKAVYSKNKGVDLFSDALDVEFNNLLNNSRETVEEKYINGFEYYRNTKKTGWNAATINQKAKELLKKSWETNKINFTDAKDYILPGIKRWLQSNGLPQFSDITLANSFDFPEIDKEIINTINNLASFAGIKIDS